MTNIPRESIKVIQPTPGMSLRDWFAGMALCGWAASYAGSTSVMEPEKSAKKAYSLADAMLDERAKTE